MTGMERNAGVVHMASYAPLFAHKDGWQWTPDLIWVDNLESYGTPNYHVQKLFSNYKGSRVVPILMNNAAVAGKDSLYASACIDSATNELILKLVNVSGNAQTKSIVLDGLKKTGAEARLTVLQNSNLQAVNSFDTPSAVSPKESGMPVKNKKLSLSLAPYSFSVVRIKM
jgi:alpha-L-arabinofuranosidase